MEGKASCIFGACFVCFQCSPSLVWFIRSFSFSSCFVGTGPPELPPLLKAEALTELKAVGFKLQHFWSAPASVGINWLRAYQMPSGKLWPRQALTYLILTRALGAKNNYYFHVTEEENRALRDWISFWRSHHPDGKPHESGLWTWACNQLFSCSLASDILAPSPVRTSKKGSLGCIPTRCQG